MGNHSSCQQNVSVGQGIGFSSAAGLYLLRLMQVLSIRHPKFFSCVRRDFYGEKRTKAGRK